MSIRPSIEHCPVSLHPEEEIRREIAPLKDGEITRIGQEILDNQEQSIEILIDFEEKLRARWSYALELNPEETGLKIARTLRQITFAAMSTVTFTELLHHVTPVLERTDRLDPPLSRVYSFSFEDACPPHRGSAARGIHSLFNQFMTHSNKVFDEISGNQDHPRHSLWLAFEGANEFLKNYAQTKLVRDARAGWEVVAADTSWRIIETLTQLGHSHTLITKEFPTKEKLMRKAVETIDQLSWPASMKSDALRTLYANFSIDQEFELFEGLSLHNTSEFMPGRNPILRMANHDPRMYEYNHPSLENGPWRKAGFCPAVPVLRMPSQEDRQIVERFYRYFEQRFNLKIMRSTDENNQGDGRFDRVTIGLLLGVLYAGETIYANWPTKLGA
ncbi:MAG TPA: hypothetical protein VD907_06175 [Verrucomicrobiae bacterium]|nr:hypothetical protein [Verrucomicrobiae bacterium]